MALMPAASSTLPLDGGNPINVAKCQGEYTMRRSHLSLLLVMLLASVLAVAGCGSTAANNAPPTATSGMPATATTTTSASANSAACKGVTTINQALTSLSDKTATATVGDVKAAQAKVTNAVNTIQAQHPTDPQGFVSQVSAANDKLTEKLAAYPDQTLISQTTANVTDLKTRVSDAQGKTQKLAGELNCPM